MKSVITRWRTVRSCFIFLHFEFSSHGFLLSLRNEGESKLQYICVIFLWQACIDVLIFSPKFSVSFLLSIYVFKRSMFISSWIFLQIILVHKKYSVIFLNKWIYTTTTIMYWLRWENEYWLSINKKSHE